MSMDNAINACAEGLPGGFVVAEGISRTLWGHHGYS